MPVLQKPPAKAPAPAFVNAQFGLYRAVGTKDALLAQKDQLGKLTKESPQQILDQEQAEKALYVVKLDDCITKGESVFIYFKSEVDLETFRNTLLCKSDAGRDFCQSSRARNTLLAAINLRKGRFGSSLLETIEDKMKTWKKPAPVREPVTIKAQPEVRKPDINRLRSLIRKLAIWTAINNESLRVSEEEYRRQRNLQMKAVRDFFTAVTQKKARFERRKIIDCMKNKTPAADLLLFPGTQPDNADYGTLFPKVYYEFSHESIKEDSKIATEMMDLFKVYILLTNEIYTYDVLPFYSSQELSLTPIPSLSAMRHSEFKVTESELRGISLHQQPFSYIMAYKVNSRTEQIESVGYEEIPKQKTFVLEINLKALQPGQGPSKLQTSVGKLVLCNDQIHPEPEMIEKPILSLFVAKNFAYLKKTFALLKADACMASTLSVFGLKKQYAVVKQGVLQSFLASKAIADHAAVAHDCLEWTKFESFVEQSLAAYNRRLLNEYPHSSQSLPPASETPAERGAIIYTDSLHHQLLNSIGLSQINLSSADSPKDYLFFGRYQWDKCKDLDSQREPFLKAIVSGMPQAMYLGVWKSLGKCHLMKVLIRQVIVSKPGAPLPSSSQAILFFLQDQGKKIEMSRFQDYRRVLETLKKSSSSSKAVEERTETLLRSYLALAAIMDEFVPEVANIQKEGPQSPSSQPQVHLLAGLTLRNTGNVVYIAHKIARLFEEQNKHKQRLAEACKDQNLKAPAPVEESDLFYLLISICVVFLPEHFLIPLPNYRPDNNAQIAALEKLGIELDHVFENRMFVSSSAVGDYKLAILLAECIRKTDSAVYDKLTNLGFPFAKFCLETTENLFYDLFNDSVLCKVWNLIFFEGSSRVKRRAQQVILSTLACLIKRCKALILDSQSAHEVVWHLKTIGGLAFDSSEFLADLIKIQKDIFVQNNEIQVVTWLEDMVSLDPRIETQLQKIKAEMHQQLDPVANCNYSYLRAISEFSTKQADDHRLQALQDAIQNITRLLFQMEVKTEQLEGKSLQAVCATLGDREYILCTKPQATSVCVTISHFAPGNFLAASTCIKIRSSVNNEQVAIDLGQVAAPN